MSKCFCKHLYLSKKRIILIFTDLFTFFLAYDIISQSDILLWSDFLKIIKLSVGDILKMKKPHPCGSDSFKVLRVGSEIRMICTGCGRDLTISRLKIEKNIKMVNEEKV